MHGIVPIKGKRRVERMNAYRIRPVKYPWPVVFYVVAILVAWAIHRFMPFHLPEQNLLLLKISGSMLGLLGVYLVLTASFVLLRSGTAVLSSRAAARLVICGPFRYTRNPIYLGYTLLTIGAGTYLDNVWMMFAALLAAAVTHLYVIRKEEMHLLARFGYEFERYCRRTRVWI